MTENKTKRFVALDAFRGLAALIVALFHANYSGLVVPGAWLAVDFFFVLSGFVLAHVYFFGRSSVDANWLRRFVSHRFARLYPLHLIALIWLYFYFYFVTDHMGCSWSLLFSFFNNLFLLNNIGFSLGCGENFNVPAWSISVEFWLNIFFACFLLGLRRGWMLFLAVALYVLLFIGRGTLTQPAVNFYEFLNSGLVRGCAGFFLGVGVYHAYRYISDGSPEGRFFFGLAEILLIVALVLLLWNFSVVSYAEFVAIYLFSAIILVFSFERGPVTIGMRVLRIERLGDWSYSIYLLHYPLIYLIKDLSWLIPEGGRVIVFLAVLLPLSWFSFHFVEKPLAARYRDVLLSDRKHILHLLLGLVVLVSLVVGLEIYKRAKLEDGRLKAIVSGLDGGSLLHKGRFEVHHKGGKLYFYSRQCSFSDRGYRFFVHFYSEFGGKYVNKDFYFRDRGYVLDGGECVASVPIPDKFSSVSFGQFISGYGRLWQAKHDLK